MSPLLFRQTLNEKIEERNDELHKLRKKTTTTVLVLTHIKEKLHAMQQGSAVLRSHLTEQERKVQVCARARERERENRVFRSGDGRGEFSFGIELKVCKNGRGGRSSREHFNWLMEVVLEILIVIVLALNSALGIIFPLGFASTMFVLFLHLSIHRTTRIRRICATRWPRPNTPATV
jgi:hypothetical protein